MTDALKVLGQSAPGATTDTVLYTVPGATSTVTSSLVITNVAAGTDTIRVRVAVAGAAAANKQYIVYGRTINGTTAGAADGSNVIIIPLGITLAATDTVNVYSTNGTTTAFQLFGVEVS